MFSKELELCICMETCVQEGIDAVYMQGDLCSVKLCICMETCVQ